MRTLDLPIKNVKQNGLTGLQNCHYLGVEGENHNGSFCLKPMRVLKTLFSSMMPSPPDMLCSVAAA